LVTLYPKAYLLTIQTKDTIMFYMNEGGLKMRFIGSKTSLLTNIEELLNKNVNGSEKTFLDLFAGTNAVGNYFKKRYKIYTNDILYFSFINAKAIIENNGGLTFNGLKSQGINSPLDFLQDNAEKYLHSKTVGYYERNYTPTNGAMYLTAENGKRIDYIRDKIDEWHRNGLLSEVEYYYLVSVLIEAIPYVSNITGTYGAFLKYWDKRALNPLKLMPIEVQDNHKENKAFNEDANELIQRISVDIAYIDTPYNGRQYASNYHLLENIARNHKPMLNGKTRVFDWNGLSSDYSIKNKALTAMNDLLEHIDATHIIVSYNNEGIISKDDLLSLMKRHALNGEVQFEKIPYRKYKSKEPSDNYDLYEMLLYIQKKENYIKSPLNYIGGKYKLLKQIVPLFPRNINTFVDLFSGGANVGINVEAKHYIFNDMNHRINEMFRYFSTQDEEELIDKINSRIDEFKLSKTNEEGYLKFREQYNKHPHPLDLYVLVSYSYNYQFRFNNSMMFNNPFGRNRSRFSENMERNLRLFVKKLHRIEAVFLDHYFNELDLSGLMADDFVYLDPPYFITIGNYNDGNRGFLNWGEQQEGQMYGVMKQLSKQGVRYALSNVLEHKGKVNQLLKGFIESANVYVHYLDYNYNNASHNSKGTGSVEVLITNYHPTTFEIITEPQV